MNINFPKGFIQIPILIAIIVGVVVVGGAGYVGVKQYQNYQAEKPQQEAVDQVIQVTSTSTSTLEISEVEKLKQEVEQLKKQQTSTPKPQAVSMAPKKRVALSNAEIIKRVKPATVFIETTEGAGSGMIIDASGYILTNAHVVEDVSIAKVKLSDGRILTALVVGRDESIDLAILKISGSNFSKVELGNSDEVVQGDEVFTLGYPFGLKGDVSFKEGTISRRISDESSTYLETSAEIHPGNSGGPLVNKYGEVIGVNTAVLGSSIKGIAIGETIKLAIPINETKSILDDLKSGRSVLQSKSSITTIEMPPPTCGGNISDLQRVGGGSYEMYFLRDYNPNIFPESNEMLLTGIIKNNSPCIAYNIKIKVTISDQGSSVQEETVTLKQNTVAGNVLLINPQNSGEYKAKITVFSTLVKNIYEYTWIIAKDLKEGVEVRVQLLSADWLPAS